MGPVSAATKALCVHVTRAPRGCIEDEVLCLRGKHVLQVNKGAFNRLQQLLAEGPEHLLKVLTQNTRKCVNEFLFN